MFRGGRVGLLVAAALACLALAVESTRNPLVARIDIPARFDRSLDVVFAALDATLRSGDRGDRADTVDLRDGRSAVPSRWQDAFARFADDDRVHPPIAGGVVFVGSSSIEYWNTLQTQFPAHAVVRRALGGATMADCTALVDRLILPYRPRVVVVYAGENDLAAGVTPERIVAAAADMVRQVHRADPATRLVFVSIKPSPARMTLATAMRRTNALMAAYVATDRRLDFVDVYDAMLDRDARPRRELYGPDGLHLSAAGYTLWHDALAGHLD